ncbi:MAG: AI-2E family transporter [Aldersonia sp.]|nr:AI-2E family transporter [Aldersonia sp.]
MTEPEPQPTTGPTHGQHSADADRARTGARERGAVIGRGLLWLAKWALCLVAIVLGAGVVWFVMARLWVIVLPVLLAVVVATVLWPPTRGLTRLGLRPGAAAGISLLGFFAVVAGVIALIVPSVIDQIPQLAERTTAGVNEVRNWLQGPPLNVRDEQLDDAVDAIVSRLQASANQIATGVFTGVSTATSALVTLFLVLVLTFFFIKDGPRFLPWLHSVAGSRAGRHIEAVLVRSWVTLGGFIRTQALVSFIDAVFIGIGLVVLGVPLALVLAVITFFGGFIPLVGAFVAGALAVLVALVAKSFTSALIVLGIIIAVQQIEGNLLQPLLQSRSMKLHAVVVLLAVTAGGSLYGIAGAFLAVPVAAVVAVLIRYLGEQIDEAVAVPEAAAASTDEPFTPPPAPAGGSLSDHV